MIDDLLRALVLIGIGIGIGAWGLAIIRSIAQELPRSLAARRSRRFLAKIRENNARTARWNAAARELLDADPRRRTDSGTTEREPMPDNMHAAENVSGKVDVATKSIRRAHIRFVEEPVDTDELIRDVDELVITSDLDICDYVDGIPVRSVQSVLRALDAAAMQHDQRAVGIRAAIAEIESHIHNRANTLSPVTPPTRG